MTGWAERGGCGRTVKTRLFLNAALPSFLILCPGLSVFCPSVLGTQVDEHGKGFDSSRSASLQKEQITQPPKEQIAEFRAGNCKVFSDFMGMPTILVPVYRHEIRVIEKRPDAMSTISRSIAFARIVCPTSHGCEGSDR